VLYRDILARQTNTDHRIISPLDKNDTNAARSRATATSSNSEGDPCQAWIAKRRSSARCRSDMEDKQMNNDGHIDTFDIDKYPIRELRFYIPGLQDPIVFNPMVTLLAVGLLWSVATYAIGTCVLRSTHLRSHPSSLASFANVALLSSRVFSSTMMHHS
jgi:hypothetical protein